MFRINILILCLVVAVGSWATVIGQNEITKHLYGGDDVTSEDVHRLGLAVENLADVESPYDPVDGDVLTYDLATQTWKTLPAAAGASVQLDCIAWVSDGGVSYTLPNAPLGDVILIFENVVWQRDGIDYSVTGSVVNFIGGVYPIGTNLIFTYAHLP